METFLPKLELYMTMSSQNSVQDKGQTVAKGPPISKYERLTCS